jgi:hypothetical protein
MITHTELTPKNRSLPHPYPIALSPISSNFGFYCYRADGGFCFHNFHAAYAAKAFLDMIIGDNNYKWIKDDQILLDNGTRIRGERSDDLERAIEYTPNKVERQWEIESPMLGYVNAFLGRSHIVIDHDGNLEHVTPVEAQERPRIVPTSTPSERKPRRQITDEERVARKKAKTKSGDYITISTICQELGHHPRDCRALLRKFKLPKPAHGWAWPPSEAAEIKKRLQKALK